MDPSFDLPELTTETPIRTYIPPGLRDTATRLLSEVDRSADFELRRLQRTRMWREKRDGREALAREEAALVARRNRCLLFRDGDRDYTHAGLWLYLSRSLLAEAGLELPHRRTFELPVPRGLPWRRTPEQHFGRPPFDHQLEACRALLEARHGTAELATGTGKSLLIALCLRELGLRSAILVYSYNVAEQLARLLVALLGERHVGTYDGRRKVLGRTITVCTAGAVHRLKANSEAYKWLAGCQVLVGDEAHTFAADVLSALATGVFAAASYRLFLTATPVRGDGLELLLRGIVGPSVAELSFRRAVELDLLARPTFYELAISPTPGERTEGDPDRLTRGHLYSNPAVAQAVGELARAYTALGWAVLVLAEEFPQVVGLLEQLPDALVLHGNTGTVAIEMELDGPPERVELAQSGGVELIIEDGSSIQMEARELIEYKLGPGRFVLVRDPRGNARPLRSVQLVRTGQHLLPEKHRDCDLPTVQAAYNSGECRVLVATSAGRVGVDLTPPSPLLLVYLVGGTSEVSYVQGVGRGARRRGKEIFHVVDVRIMGVPRLEAHADARAEIAGRLWAPPQRATVAEIVEAAQLAPSK